jgi:hypothetical protein
MEKRDLGLLDGVEKGFVKITARRRIAKPSIRL